jgi:hypothetical protein
MGTLNVPTKPNGVSGVSLIQMQEKFEEMMAEMAALKAEKATPVLTVPTLTIPTAQPAQPTAQPTVAKVAAKEMTATVWKPGQAIALNHTASEKASGPTSGKPCGWKSENGPCKRCNGPFNPLLHYTMEAVVRLDGSDAPLTHATWKQARFVGISLGAGFEGNVVIVGFGKEVINLRAKTALALIAAFAGDKSPVAAHIVAVIKANPKAFPAGLLD